MSHSLTLQLGASNVYLLATGSEYVAIDAGPDYDGAWASAAAQLAAAHLAPADVHSILVTHGHPDHCALAATWQRRAGAEVWIATGDRVKMTAGGRDPAEVRERALEFLAANGVPGDLIAEARAGPTGRSHHRVKTDEQQRLRNLRSLTPEHGEWPGPLRATPAEPDRLIEERDIPDIRRFAPAAAALPRPYASEHGLSR